MDRGLGERLFKFAEIKKQENILLMNQVSLKRF